MSQRLVKRVLSLLCVVCAVGCTSMEQLNDPTTKWEERSVPISYQQAYRNLRHAFRACPYEYHEAVIFNDIKTAEVDVWHPTMLNTASPLYFGRIVIVAIDASTSMVKTGLISDSEARRNRWHRWAEGDMSCYP